LFCEYSSISHHSTAASVITDSSSNNKIQSKNWNTVKQQKMGACQSAQSTVDGVTVVEIHKTQKERQQQQQEQKSQMKVSTTQATFPRDVSDAETADSQHNNIVGSTMLVPVKKKEKDRTEFYKDRPGYSSGGSSFHDTSSEEETDVAAPSVWAVRSDAAPRGHGTLSPVNSTRHEKLKEWKMQLSSTGDLTQTIVHIEVSSFDDCLHCSASKGMTRIRLC
jgi:hypothetical protein